MKIRSFVKKNNRKEMHVLGHIIRLYGIYDCGEIEIFEGLFLKGEEEKLTRQLKSIGFVEE